MDINSLLRIASIPLFIVAVTAELIWARRTGADTYSAKESAASVGTIVLYQIGKLAGVGFNYAVFTQVQTLTPLSIPNNVATFVLAFFAAEFFYYWYHRWSHEIPVLWSMHFVHHSSPEYNFLVAPRLSAIGPFITPFFFLPMVLAGFSPEFVAGSLSLGLLFQFCLHTEAIGRLGRLEGIINTPSAHRVHHGSNDQYIDTNYGGALMIWDRMFGTYVEEGEPVRYGVTTGHYGYNPFRLQFRPLWLWITRGGWTRQKPDSGDANLEAQAIASIVQTPPPATIEPTGATAGRRTANQ